MVVVVVVVVAEGVSVGGGVVILVADSGCDADDDDGNKWYSFLVLILHFGAGMDAHDRGERGRGEVGKTLR